MAVAGGQPKPGGVAYCQKIVSRSCYTGGTAPAVTIPDEDLALLHDIPHVRLGALLLVALLAACSVVPTATPVATPAKAQATTPASRTSGAAAPTDAVQEGRVLFVRHCGACHKIEHMQDRGVSRIRSAARQFPIMYQTRKLRDDEVQKIAGFLAAAKPARTAKQPAPAKTTPVAAKSRGVTATPPATPAGKSVKTTVR